MRVISWEGHGAVQKDNPEIAAREVGQCFRLSVCSQRTDARCVDEDETLAELATIGFCNVAIPRRLLMASLLVASRPG